MSKHSNLESVNFPQAIKMGSRKYVTFQGRATRSEFWYWQVLAIFVFAASALATVVPGAALAFSPTANARGVILIVNALVLVNLWFVLAGITVGVRRLHDANLSGWWQLIGIVPIVGWIAWIILMTQPSGPMPNRFDVQTSGADISEVEVVNVFGRKVSHRHLREMGLTYIALGVVITAGIYIESSFYSMDPNHRSGLLGYSEGLILIGAVTFLIGWKRLGKEDDPLRR
jgi:uncharacterized membrane protein YhaH (DUF805 family)